MTLFGTRCVLLVATATLLTCVLAVPSEAGTYDVKGCEEDVREKLPPLGWSLAGPVSAFRITEDCTQAPTVVETVGQMPQGTAGGIRLTVPRPLSITAFKMRAVYDAHYSPFTNPQWWWNGEVRLTQVGGQSVALSYCPGKDNSCTGSYMASPIIDLDPPAQELDWLLRCAPDSPGRCDWGSSIRLLTTWFRITDPVKPTLLRPPTGALISGARRLTGIDTTAFEATDVGGGLFRAQLQVDGQIVAESAFSTILPTCRRPFRTARPCPTKVAGTLEVDTTKLADGTHDAMLSIYDATNSNSVTYGPVTFDTLNRRADSYCVSTDAARVRVSTPKRALRFGRGFRVTARVANAAGWEGVLLDGRGQVAAISTSTIPPQGTVAMKVPAGATRWLRLAIRPQGSKGKYICSAVHKVPVKAPISLNVSPRHLFNGRTVRIGGRLRGRSRSHRSVVIQARAVGNSRWATVKVVRTDRYGRYRMRYRFLNTFANVIYVFRSQIRAEKGYPYTSGRSKTVRVRVSG